MSSIHCLKCDLVIEEDEECVQCDFCMKFLHLACAELTATEVKCMPLKKKRTLKLVCSQCEQLLRTLPTLAATITRLTEELLSLSAEVRALKDSGVRPSSDVAPVPPAPVDELVCMEETIAEYSERQLRSKNVLLFNIPERSNGGNDVSDEQFIGDLVSTSSCKPSVLKVVRLGMPKQGVIRPLKVTCDSSSDAHILLSLRGRLPTSARMSLDKTPRQRAYFKRILDELKMRQGQGEPNLRIKHVRGVPTIVPMPDTNAPISSLSPRVTQGTQAKNLSH